MDIITIMMIESAIYEGSVSILPRGVDKYLSALMLIRRDFGKLQIVTSNYMPLIHTDFVFIDDIGRLSDKVKNEALMMCSNDKGIILY